MTMWDILYSKQAVKDLEKVKTSLLYPKLKELINIIKQDPYANPPKFEKLVGFKDIYSRRLNIQHRLVYQVFDNELSVKVISLWGHYDDN
ncbi:toxin YoeB [Gammaproteobacteria bacterium]